MLLGYRERGVAGEFWLDDRQWARLQPMLPNKPRGVPRVDDRRVINGIVHVLLSGCRRKDAPAICGPPKTPCNRNVRWAAKGVWRTVVEALAAEGGPPTWVLIDSTHVKAYPSAAGDPPRRRHHVMVMSLGASTCPAQGADACQVFPDHRLAAALPAVHAQVEHDLALPRTGNNRALTTAVQRLALTLIRVGNNLLARSNQIFGRTTLEKPPCGCRRCRHQLQLCIQNWRAPCSQRA